MTTNYPTPYLVGTFWWFKYTDQTGRRRQKSTKKKTEREANKVIREFVDALPTRTTNADSSLGDILAPYKDPKTNPRKKEADLTGGKYSLRHAKHIAKNAADLEAVIGHKFLTMHAEDITRLQSKQIREMIAARYGQTAKAQDVFKVYKSVMAQAADDGIIRMAPTIGMADIKYAKTENVAIPLEDLLTILSHPEVFPSDYARVLFTVFATTGLRRAELLALDPRQQLNGKVLTVDRAFKDDSLKEIGFPDWLDDIHASILLNYIRQDDIKNYPSESARILVCGISKPYGDIGKQ